MEDLNKKKSWKSWLGWGVAVYVGLVLILFGIIWLLAQKNPEPAEEQLTRFTGDTSTHQFSGELVPEWSPSIGPEDAKVTIVEFSDFQCPFCKAAFQPVRQILNEFPDDVRLVYRHFPISTIHPLATDLAHASMCAHEQEKFWPFHDQVFLQQENIRRGDITQIAQTVGLNVEAFQFCNTSGKYDDEIEKDLADVIGLGGRGTPTWIVNGELVAGVITEDLWRQIINSILAS